MKKLVLCLLLGSTLLAQQSTSTVTPKPKNHYSTWAYVNSGVFLHTAGTCLDLTTSWKQPEGNSFLRQPSGPYAGLFYTKGLEFKVGISGAVISVSYLLAWHHPRLRKWIGYANMGLGVEYSAVGYSNLVRNPAFH